MSDDDRTITIVSGIPRSGTSMMMKMLEVGGREVFTDNVRHPDEDNPSGYYELEEVKTLPKGHRSWLHDAEGKAVKVISPLLRFLPQDHRYHVILMRRAIDEVLASQRIMLQNRGEATFSMDDERLAAIYGENLEQTERWASETPSVDLVPIDYNGLLNDPGAELERLVSFLGGDLDLEAMAAVIDPALYRQRKK